MSIYDLKLPFLTFFLILVVIGNVIVFILSIRQDKELYFSAWKKMSSFEKTSLYGGILNYSMFLYLKQDPSYEFIIFKILIELLLLLGGAMFVVGAIAFLGHAHEINRLSNK